MFASSSLEVLRVNHVHQCTPFAMSVILFKNFNHSPATTSRHHSWSLFFQPIICLEAPHGHSLPLQRCAMHDPGVCCVVNLDHKPHRMIAKAERQDQRFLLDLAALQDKHVDSAKELLGESKELTYFVGRLLEDINNLKAMLNAMSIGGCLR
eukprot:scaffold238161_cov22-Tisochrysis_lutea.AAC.1